MTEEKKPENSTGEEKKKKTKKQEYEGGRWVAVGLLIITLVLSLAFYLSGQLKKGGWGIFRVNERGSSQSKEGMNEEATWTFEK